MGDAANIVSLRHCPNCGLELPASGWAGLCPRCLVLVSLRGTSGPVGPSESAAESPAGDALSSDLSSSARSKPHAPAQISGGAELFGDYQLLEEIGRGGMGVVFKARQRSLNRMVAVKILLAGPFAGGQRLERFRAEAEAVAQLQHPNIVAIYGFGEQGGTSFFSMEYVPGRTLADLVSQRPLPPDLAARYLQIVADAVHYAHQQGILHRDLKPSNVLIDSAGRPRVTDFGLAKRLPVNDSAAPRDSQPSIIDPQLTITGQVLGSPSYVAPEQAGAKRGSVSPSSDIYALGAILFHLLTGRPPFLSETLEGTLLQVLTTEPIGARRLNPAVPRDLETICSKCLQKDPERRYATAKALTEDLGRFLNHQPIMARPANPLEKLWRWCQRRPALAVILLLLCLSFGSGLAGILWQWRRAHMSELSLQRNLYATDVNLAQVAIEDNNLGRATALLQRYIPKSAAEPDLRGFEWRYLWGLCKGDQRASLRGDGGIISCVRFSPNGRLIASAGFDQTVTIWDAATQRALVRLTGLSGPVCRLALSFSPDGKLLAAAGGTNLLVWGTDTWKMVRQLEAHSAPMGGGAYQVTLTPDGRGLAARINQDVQVWETAAWQKKIVFPGAVEETASLLAYSADGKWLVTYNDHRVRFWDSETGLQRGLSAERLSQPLGLAIAPDSTVLAIGDTSGKLRLIDLRTGETLRSVEAHKGLVQGVAFSPDGRIVATCGGDQLVHLWDVQSLQNAATFKGHQSEVWAIAFAPDGQTLASASKDGTVNLWSVKPRPAQAHTLDLNSRPLWFSPDSKVLLTASSNGSLHYWDADTGKELRAIPPLETGGLERYFTTVSSDGTLLATSVEDGRIFLWDLQAGTCVATNQIDSYPADALAFSPDKQRLAVSSGQYVGGIWRGGNRLLDLQSGEIKTLSNEYAGIRDHACLTFSPDGTVLAGAGANYSIVLWDLPTGKQRSVLRGHAWNVMGLTFSPDGTLLASGGNDNTARLWDVATGSQVASLTGHKTGIVQVAFSSDGRTLATSGSDKTVRLWSVITHRELLTLKPATGWTHFLFSPDGHILATGGLSGPLELWRAPED